MHPPEWQTLLDIAHRVFNHPSFLEAVNAGKSPAEQRSTAVLHIMLDGPQPVDPQQVKGVMWPESFELLSREKKSAYFHHSGEKSCRVADSPRHLVSSWQTRDIGNKKYGGAIRAGRFALGASGLTELWEEVFVVCVAIIGKLITRAEGEAIMGISGSLELFQQHRLAEKIPGL